MQGLRRAGSTVRGWRAWATAISLGASLLAGAARAEDGLGVRNEAALARGFALPALGAPQVETAGRLGSLVTVDWTNEYVSESGGGGESLVIDGETVRTTLALRYGLAPRLEIGAALPVIVVNGGVMDGLIDGWHDFWNLPDGGRRDAPRDRRLYQVQRDGQTRLDVRDSTTTLGDLELSAGYQLAAPLALRALVKLPTGDEGALTGGTFGTALWLDWDPFASFGGPSKRWFGFVSGGGSWNQKGEVLGDAQNSLVGLAGAGIGYRLFAPLSALVQFTAHTPLYSDTSLNALKRPGGQLAVGGRWHFTLRTALDFGFQEDVITESSPDFSIHLGLRID